ncbi:MAG: hypothetical protein JW798_05240, partial [Prolixibacteraceae bacterium]|nr:hypothetical protein [Prolixibacteraceae bacterium]
MAPGDSVKAIREQEKPREHIPAKATMFSAVLPGLGQIYNKKYWKLPIVYGGFIGLGYMINSYNSSYLTNKQYYYDLDDDDPETNSFITYFGDVSDRSVSSMQTTL